MESNCESMASKKSTPQVRLTAMIATDSKPWIRLPLTDEGLQGLSHRRIHSVEGDRNDAEAT